MFSIKDLKFEISKIVQKIKGNHLDAKVVRNSKVLEFKKNNKSIVLLFQCKEEGKTRSHLDLSKPFWKPSRWHNRPIWSHGGSSIIKKFRMKILKQKTRGRKQKLTSYGIGNGILKGSKFV